MKPATTLEQQLKIFKERNLIVENDKKVLRFLKFNNYYRFSGYTKCFCKSNDCFEEKVTFEDIYGAYAFDIQLRSLLNRYIEQIEVIYKTLLAYHLANEYSPLFYKNSNYYLISEEEFDAFNAKINDDVENMSSNEAFATHFGSEMPIWALVELISFGTMSKFYSYIKQEYFSTLCCSLSRLDLIRISSGLHSMTIVRNICAHRARLFNRGFTYAPRLSNRSLKHLKFENNPKTNNRSLFIYCCSLLELLNDYEYGEKFINDISDIIDNAPQSIDVYKNFGFFSNWKAVLLQINLDNKQ